MEHLINNFFDEVKARLNNEDDENFALFLADIEGEEHARVEASVLALAAFLVKHDQARELLSLASTIAEKYVEHETEDY